MPIISKKNQTLKKAEVSTQKSISIGFRKVVFYHEAAAGESSIDLASLSMPSTLSGAGYTNPSTQSLLAMNLTFYRDNLLLISSARGILQAGISYTVSGHTITFTTDFGDTLEGEIFTGVMDPVAKTGAQIVDAAPLISTGTLAANQTDYVVGDPYEANKYPSKQIGAVMVFVDGLLQFRNVGNATADPGADGNYEEVAVTGGLSTLIRFNESDTVNDRSIVVVSTTLIAERPTDSMMAVIERQQGQIDTLVEYVALLAGVDETNFQSAPNNVDLKQFGDRVLDLEAETDVIVSGTYSPTLTGTANVDSVTQISAFNYMRVGNVVTVSGNVDLNPTAGAPTATAFTISLPVARANFSDTGEGAGHITFRSTATSILPGRILSTSGAQTMTVDVSVTATGSIQCPVTFMYRLT